MDRQPVTLSIEFETWERFQTEIRQNSQVPSRIVERMMQQYLLFKELGKSVDKLLAPVK